MVRVWKIAFLHGTMPTNESVTVMFIAEATCMTVRKKWRRMKLNKLQARYDNFYFDTCTHIN